MIEVYYAEDDETIGKSVKEYLEQQNCKVAVFDRIADVKKALIGHLPTIVLLDWNMPDGQGNELCLWIRERWKTLPIIYLTVRGDSHDIVTGFQNGADDYVVKPFEPKELIARIYAVLRRTSKNMEDNEKEIVLPDIDVNLSQYELTVKGEKIEMPPKELELLFFLCKNPDRVFTRDQLLDNIWGYDYFGDGRTVDVHIKRIRQKIDGKSDKWELKTVWGVGYKFELKG